MIHATPEMIAAAWAAWHSRHGGKLGPGPAFVEAINAALEKMETPAMTEHQKKEGHPAPVTHVEVTVADLEKQIKDLKHDLAGAEGRAKNATSNSEYWRGQYEALAADPARHHGGPAMSDTVLIGCEDGDIPCDRCSGTGNLIKDWDRYISAKTTEEIEDCESDCPDCSGYGRFKAETPSPQTNVDGWTGRKCEYCKGHGVRMQDGEERSCPDCAGTGDEYGSLSDPADEINPYEQALRDAVEPFLDWLEQREEGAHIKEVREGLIGVEDVIPDDHVVLGAHLRAQKDQGVLTIGHFRRLQAAYDGKATPAPQSNTTVT